MENVLVKILEGEMYVCKIDCKNSWYRKSLHEQCEMFGLDHKSGFHPHMQKILNYKAHERIKECERKYCCTQDDYYFREIYRNYRHPDNFMKRPMSFIEVSANEKISKDLEKFLPYDLCSIVLKKLHHSL